MTWGRSCGGAGLWPLVLLVSWFLWCHVATEVRAESTGPVRVAAFNIQIFGTSKADKPDVMAIIVKIVKRYDIILIQEIRDTSQQAIKDLLDELNKDKEVFAYVQSERLGRSSSKEQYAFIYREDAGLSVPVTYQYPDTDDHFQRPPFAVHFKSLRTSPQDFVLVGVHVSPSDAVAEINALDDVRQAVYNKFNQKAILIMGDFNADCSYVSNAESSKLKLRDSKYRWWIGDDVDTTVGRSDCAYDRFVMTGEEFIDIVKSVGVFRFDTAYQLSQEQAKAVSDHYPIEMNLTSTTSAITTSSTTTTDKSSAPSTVRRGILQNVITHLVWLTATQLMLQIP